jgi:IQ calmodulin-binding motif
MDTLDRQPGEKFYIWAKRIQARLQFYESVWGVSYPRTKILVNVYINIIRDYMHRPHFKHCNLCFELIDIGHNEDNAWFNFHLHYLVCPRSLAFGDNTINALRIQATFRGYITRKKFLASLNIQRPVLAWLYRPNGPMMRKAERHFYSLA